MPKAATKTTPTKVKKVGVKLTLVPKPKEPVKHAIHLADTSLNLVRTVLKLRANQIEKLIVDLAITRDYTRDMARHVIDQLSDERNAILTTLKEIA